MFDINKLLKNICSVGLSVSIAFCLCTHVVQATPPTSDSSGERFGSIEVENSNEALGVSISLNSDFKYNDGYPIRLVNSVMPSKNNVAVYLRVVKGTGATAVKGAWIKVWDYGKLLANELDKVSVTELGDDYNLYYYIDGKDNYDDIVGDSDTSGNVDDYGSY